MNYQSERLGKEPIPKLLLSLTVPGMVGLFVMSLYNVVDTIYISRGVGTVGVAAVSIAFPIQIIVMGLAGAIGIGGSSLISRALGADDKEEANEVFGNLISLILLVGIIGAFTSLFLLTPSMRLFGASDTLLPYTADYLEIIMYGTILFTSAIVLTTTVRAEGNAKTAMITMLVSAVLNIVFTPIFIFGFDMGIKGAAIGTVLAQATTVIYLIIYYASGKSTLKLKSSYLLPRFSIIMQVLTIGASAFVRQASSSLMLIIANNMLTIYGGDLAVAVLGIGIKILLFSLMPIMGIVQGLLPVVGYNYGAKQYRRVTESIALAMKWATVVSVLGFTLVMAFPSQLIMIFTDDAAVIEMGSSVIRITYAFLATIGIQMVTGGVFQALGYAKEAFILSMSRQVLFVIPLLFLLPLMFELSGIWLAFPLADFLSFLLALWFIKKHEGLFIKLKSSSVTVSQY